MKNNISNPLVSIIIPVFNGADYLNQAIDSALAQTYQNIEVIVIDDGSNDQGATEAIALSYGNRVSYYRKENGGVATALNLGIAKMKGTYFSWLSHDDLYAPDKIETQVLEISQHDNKTILYSDYRVFGKEPFVSFDGKLPTITPQDFRCWITIENHIHGCTLLIPRSAFEEYGPFNPALRTTQDYAMWFNLAKTYKFLHMPTITVFARVHPNQATKAIASVVKRECDELIKNFIDQLEPHEIIRATKKDLKSSYLKIADACLKKGFTNAYSRANELAELSGSATSLIDNQGIRKMEIDMHNKAKSFLKKIIPSYFYKKKYVSADGQNSQQTRSQSHNLQDKFTHVYRENIFGGKESRSGEGSNFIQTAVIRREIPRIIKSYNISTFLDAPCGDWYWMRTVDLGVQKYIGVDIVAEMIDKNNQEFGNSIVSFQALNLSKDTLPHADLVFSRDCFVHLNFDDILRIISSFKRSKAKYLLTTTFTNREKNSDLIDENGNELFWRTLNMQLPPFNFPPPIELINEECTEGDKLYMDKSLGLWLLEDITVPAGY